MTDRYYALTVLLEDIIRDDDAQPIIDAIQMVKGVMEVRPHVADSDLYWAKVQARRELGEKIIDILYPKD